MKTNLNSILSMKSFAFRTLALSILIPGLLAADEVDTLFKQAGWTDAGKQEVATAAGKKAATIYQKMVGQKNAQLTYLAENKVVNGGLASGPNTVPKFVLSDGGLFSIGWSGSSTFIVAGISQKVGSSVEANEAIRKFEEIFTRNTKELQRQRQFKNALGSYGNTAPVLVDVSFKDVNILLKFRNASGEATLEVSPEFGYMRSNVAGKDVDPESVRASPLRTLAEQLQLMDEKAKQTERNNK